jgi:hypothetical protein
MVTERARGGWAVAAAAVGFLLTALLFASLGLVDASASPAQVCPPLCPSTTAAPTTAPPATTAAPTTRTPTTAPPATSAAPRATAATTATSAQTAASTTVPGAEPAATGSVPLLVPGPTDIQGAPVTTAAPPEPKPVSNTDNTGTVVALVIAGLLLVALLLALLTYWYWRNTRPNPKWADEKAPTEDDKAPAEAGRNSG